MNRLYRSRHDRMLAGVCGGLGEYFGIDSSLIRLALVLLIVFGGTGFLAYLIAWIVVPEEPYDYQEYKEKRSEAQKKEPKRDTTVEDVVVEAKENGFDRKSEDVSFTEDENREETEKPE